MRRVILLLSLLLPLIPPICRAGGPRVVAGFLESSARPGGLVGFEAKLESSDYAAFDLKLPETPLLRLLSEEGEPVRYDDGRFSQTHRWFFQTVASGTVSFGKLEAKILQTDGGHTLPLPASVLTISPFAESDSSDQPQPLPAVESPNPAPHRWLPIALLAPIIAAVLVCMRMRRTRK